jgi:hypothetical protein
VHWVDKSAYSMGSMQVVKKALLKEKVKAVM